MLPFSNTVTYSLGTQNGPYCKIFEYESTQHSCILWLVLIISTLPCVSIRCYNIFTVWSVFTLHSLLAYPLTFIGVIWSYNKSQSVHSGRESFACMFIWFISICNVLLFGRYSDWTHHSHIHLTQYTLNNNSHIPSSLIPCLVLLYHHYSMDHMIYMPIRFPDCLIQQGNTF